MGIEIRPSDAGPVVVLPSLSDLNVADELIAALTKVEAETDSYAIDGSAVARISTPCIQVLLSALHGNGRLSRPSDALMEAIIDLGLLPHLAAKVDAA